MTQIEKMRWAKNLLEEDSGGTFELVAGNVHGDLFLRCADNAHVGLYLSVLPNMETGRYDLKFHGYTRINSGYYDASGMQRLIKEYQMVAYLIKEMETANISLLPDELAAFAAELSSPEEQQITAPQLGM